MKLYLNENKVKEWFAQGGDDSFLLSNKKTIKDGIIVELGAYKGLWTKKICERVHNCEIHAFEPINEFASQIASPILSDNKIIVHKFGVAAKQKNDWETKNIYLDGDSTSAYHNITNNAISCDFLSLNKFFSYFDKDIDLIQINIEGEEYELLSEMIEIGLIHKIKSLQVQFHLGPERAVERRNEIRKNLEKNGFKEDFCFEFVWEKWSKI